MADDALGAAEAFQAVGQGAGEIGPGGRGAVGGQFSIRAQPSASRDSMAGLTCSGWIRSKRGRSVKSSSGFWAWSWSSGQ